MSNIKYRQLVDGRWHYWGYIDGCFIGPITNQEPRPINCQFTGLHDVNGVEIYEGDILRLHSDYSDEETMHEVKFYCSTGYPAFELSPSISNDMNGFAAVYQGDEGSLTVVGNIYCWSLSHELTNNS